MIIKASKEVVKVWAIEGNCPELHRRQQKYLRHRWPELYKAITNLVKTTLESKAGL